MKIDKKMLRDLFTSWIRHDAQLWGELRQIQIKLLYDRIVKEKTYLQIALEYNATIHQVRAIFKAIIMKLERSHGKEIGNLLQQINEYLEDVELGRKKPNDPIKNVHLN